MKSNVNNLQIEARSLATNPVFLAQFLDEPVFDIPRPKEDSLAAPQVALAPDAEGMDRTDVGPQESASLEFPKDPVPVDTIQQEVLLPNHLELAASSTTTADWAGKVLVLTPDKPSESENALLNKVLSAVSLAEHDFVHLHRRLSAKELIAFESAKIILSFGAVTDFAADHQVRSKRITVIISSALHALEQDVEAKKKLWLSLKGFFK